MDYLTILTTRSLILFPSTPLQILIPLTNFLSHSHDADLAHFLLTHLLAHNPNFSYQEAEVLVWKEINKAGTFMKNLGVALATSSLTENDLESLAKQCGLGFDINGGGERGRERRRRTVSRNASCASEITSRTREENATVVA